MAKIFFAEDVADKLGAAIGASELLWIRFW